MWQFSAVDELPPMILWTLLISHGVCLIYDYSWMSVPTIILLDIVVMLGFSHFYFYSLRFYHSSNIRLYIDYVYLSVAVVGILVGSVDYIHNEKDKDRFAFVKKMEESISTERWLISGIQISFCPPDKSNERDCHALVAATAASEILSEAAVSFEERRDSAVVKDLTLIADGLADILSAYQGKEADVLLRATHQIQRNLQVIIVDSQAPKAWFDRIPKNVNMRIVGFVLLSSALALRLTRVTVEAKGWFHKAKPPPARSVG